MDAVEGWLFAGSAVMVVSTLTILALALAGCNVPEIMAVVGHKSPKMAIFYVQQADKIRLGETATAKWETHIQASNA